MAKKQPADIDIDQKRRAFRRTMAAIGSALQELAGAIGLEATSAMDKPERYLDALDTFLATLNPKSLGYPQMRWIQARSAFFTGELLRRRHGGTWFLQEDPNEQFYMTPVVGGFDDDPSVTVSPPAIIRKIFTHNPPSSLREELATLGLDISDTAPQVDGGMMTGRHRSLVPMIRCSCGQALWDFAGGHGGKAIWLPDAHISALHKDLSDRIGAWLASCEDGHRAAFIQHVLGMNADDEEIDNHTIVAELVARASSAHGRPMFECPGCGRLWLEAEKNRFVSYSPDTDERGVFEDPMETPSPDSVRVEID
jgi:hypothetical protein